MKEESKKKWEKPKLIVLVKTNPEERVLSACKEIEILGPGDSFGGCSKINLGECIVCPGSYGS